VKQSKYDIAIASIAGGTTENERRIENRILYYREEARVTK